MPRTAKSDMPSDLNLVIAALDDDDFAAAVLRLRGVADPESILVELANSRLAGPRGYVTPLAIELLPRDRAIPLVRKMLDDSDNSNRIDAVAAYAALDPDGMPRLLGKLRKRLRSMSDHEVLSTAWTLATLGDAESAVEIAAVRDVEDPSLWLHKALDVVWTYMSAPDRVIGRIHEHDHDSMMWLTYAATLIGTEGAESALRACSAGAPDDHCRMLCQNSLKRFVARGRRPSSPLLGRHLRTPMEQAAMSRADKSAVGRASQVMPFMKPDSEGQPMAADSLLTHSAAEIEARRLAWTAAGFEIGPLTWRDVGSGWPYPLVGTPDGRRVDSVGVRCTRGATEMRVVVFEGGWADVEIVNLGSEQIETSAPLASDAAAVGLILDRAFQRADELGRAR